jgi:DNA repair protein RadC
MSDSTYNYLPVFTLKAVREKSIKYCPKVGTPNQAAAILRAYLRDKDCEHLVVLMVDNQNNYLGLAVAAKGGISGLYISPREVMKHCIIHRAHAFILGHNHPSGSTEPSVEDLEFTARVAEAGKIMGCPLLDHIIISSGLAEGWRSIYTAT